MSVPAQFQLRDLVNHLMVGIVFLIVAVAVLTLPTFAPFMPRCGVGLLPQDAATRVLMLLAVAYAIGSIFPSTTVLRRRFLERRGRGSFFARAYARLGCWLTGSGAEDPRVAAFARYEGDGPLMKCFKRGVTQTFGPTGDFPHAGAEVFVLCRSWLETHAATPAETDIERHYVTMHFNFKLRSIFILAILAVLGDVYGHRQHPLTLESLESLLFLLTFSILTRAAGITARSNERHYHRLVVESFAVQAGSLQPANVNAS